MKLTEINIRDPFILSHDGKYYMYGTRVGQPNADSVWGIQLGFDVYVSDDLVEWSEPKSVFEQNENFWGEKDFWAPEVHKYNGKFYMFASFKAEGKCRGTHILVSDSPDGRFIPVSEKPATPEDRECLDGTLYVSRKGQPHIVFCHEWLQIADGTVCAAKLAPDLSGIIEEPRVLWHGSDFTGKKPGQDNYVTDGPFMIRGENDELYCIWSTFADQGYAEVVSVSDNGEIDGNWSVLKEPLFEKDGGHGMVFRTFTGEDMFVMHKPNTSTLERPVLSRLYKNDRKLHIVE